MLLPLCKSALIFTRSINTKQSPAFIIFSHGPNLPFEVAVCDATDS